MLKNLKERIGEGVEATKELLREYGDSSFSKGRAGREVNGVVGAVGAALLFSERFVEEAVGLVNAATNVGILTFTSEGQLAGEAAGEIDDTLQGLKQSLVWVVENPQEAAAALLRSGKSVVETLRKAASGDPEAIAETGAFGLEAGIDILSGKAGLKAAEATRELAEAAASGSARKARRRVEATAKPLEEPNLGSQIPDSRIAGDGPSAALKDGPEFGEVSQSAPPDKLSRALERAAPYGNRECVQCARAILEQLGPDPSVSLVKLRTKGSNGSIGVTDSSGQFRVISDTGLHVGVDIDGMFVDNIFKQGLPASDLGKRFEVPKEGATFRLRSSQEFFSRDQTFNQREFLYFLGDD